MSNKTKFQEQFGGYDMAVGSVMVIRSFIPEPNGKLFGQAGGAWLPGENVAVCKIISGEMISFAAMVSNRTFVRSWVGPTPPPPMMPETPGPHTPPLETCTCGFYGYTDLDAFEYDGSTNGPTGVVQMYGRTLIGTRGVRAEKARIVALSIPRGWWNRYDAIHRAYPDIPVYARKRNMLSDFPIDTHLAEGTGVWGETDATDT